MVENLKKKPPFPHVLPPPITLSSTNNQPCTPTNSDVWSPTVTGAAADWFRSIENSGAHAVFVGALIIAALLRSDRVEVFDYHSLLEGDVASQPGFAILAINDTGAYISPVAQLLAHLSSATRILGSTGRASTINGLPSPSTQTQQNITVFGQSSLACMQIVAVCNGLGEAAVYALNRCDRAVRLLLLLPCLAIIFWWSFKQFC